MDWYEFAGILIAYFTVILFVSLILSGCTCGMAI